MAFDLDNEELRATRRLHGQDDGLYEETSDKISIDMQELQAINKKCEELNWI